MGGGKAEGSKPYSQSLVANKVGNCSMACSSKRPFRLGLQWSGGWTDFSRWVDGGSFCGMCFVDSPLNHVHVSKAEFSQLSEEELSDLAKEIEDERTEARNRRMLAELGMEDNTVPPVPNALQPMALEQPSEADALGDALVLAHASPPPPPVTVEMTLAPLVGGHATWPDNGEDANVKHKEAPLTIAKYERVLREYESHRKRKTDCCAGMLRRNAHAYKEFTREYARARGWIPKRVIHHRPCRGICVKIASATTRSIFEQARVEISGRAKYHQKSRKLDLEDLTLLVMIRSEFNTESEAGDVIFGFIHQHLGQGTAKIGLQSESILPLDIVNVGILAPNNGVVSPVGAKLKFARLPYIEPDTKTETIYMEGLATVVILQPPSQPIKLNWVPMNLGALGTLKMLPQGILSAYLGGVLDGAWGTSGGFWVVGVAGPWEITRALLWGPKRFGDLLGPWGVGR